ncbi:MAG: NYN domain-containing protein [Chloroflexi bacterium]|nr:NYN domain-containing protein [Chloroflexota bacterium]
MRHIIVDGYNVIRADARLQALERTSLERAREVLVQTLASSPRLANDALTVVFDGKDGSRRHVHSHRLGRVELLYSGQGQSADEVIVQQARSLAGRDRVIVVSNDVEVRERCRAAGCQVSGSENLLAQLPGGFGSSRVRDDEDEPPRLSTAKRGNPRRSPRRARRQRDLRF